MCLATSLFNLYSIIDTLSEKQQLCTGRSQRNGNLTKVCLALLPTEQTHYSPSAFRLPKAWLKEINNKNKSRGSQGEIKISSSSRDFFQKKKITFETLLEERTHSQKRERKGRIKTRVQSFFPLF